MQELRLPDNLKRKTQDFINGLKRIYADELVSVIIYGSAVSGEFADKHSNLNILAVLKDADLDNLKKAADLVRRFKMIKPLFLTERYIATSTDIFPIEFLDMRENYRVLYGKDILRDILIDIRNLRFQCEQELKAKLLNLRQFYLRIHQNKALLRDLLFRSATSVLHILRNVLRIKGKIPPYLKQDILKEVAADLGVNRDIFEKILAAKNKQIRLGGRDTEELFTGFVRELERVVDIVDRL